VDLEDAVPVGPDEDGVNRVVGERGEGDGS